MADVFLSYATEDRDRARLVADALRGAGWTVWSSQDILSGTAIRAEISHQINEAKGVVLLWSNASLSSAWVRDEADSVSAHKVVTHVTLESVRLPTQFRESRCVDLSGWNGDPESHDFRQLVIDLMFRVGLPHEVTVRKPISLPKTAPSAAERSSPEATPLNPKPSVEPAPRAPTAKRTSNHRVFLSYRRDDAQGEAGRLHDRLIDAIGSDSVFMDVDSIPIGIDFVDYINEQLAECALMIVVIGPTWATVTDEGGQRRLDDPEDLVRAEIVAALERKLPVIPVLVRDASMPRRDVLPEDLRPLARRNALEMSHQRWRHDSARLVKAIRGFLRMTSGS